MNILDWLFPVTCLCCDSEGEQLCPACCAHVSRLDRTPPVPDGLDGIWCATAYAAPISDAIHALKYGSASSLGPTLGSLMSRLLNIRTINDQQVTTPPPTSYQLQATSFPPNPLIIPVPIHLRRKRERGFNQAELLAREICTASNWELRTDILTRTRYTTPQASLDRKERQTNLAGAFVILDAEAIYDRHIVLIDDVLTTGSTLTACATTLRDANPASITALCLAYDALSTCSTDL